MSAWARADSIPEFASLFGQEAREAQEVPDKRASAEAPAAAQPPASQKHVGNYFIRHWRGQLSLPVSYWVNGFLITILFVVVIAAIPQAEFMGRVGAKGTGLWILAVLLLSIGCTVWQSIGIWRSADQHPGRGGSKGWATTAKVMVFIGFLRLIGTTTQQIPMMEQGFRLVLGKDDTPHSQLHVVNRGTELEVSGGMTIGTTETVRSVLDATPTIQIVQLNNVGGFITEGDRLGQLISARGLSTYTARECVSACLLAFMGGKKRYLSSGGKLGFHQASVAGVGGEVAKEGNDTFRRVLTQRGVPSAFVDRALSTAASSMWYPTVDELRAAHVITTVVDGNQFATTNVAAWRDRAALEADFAATPLFSALRHAEPGIYEDLKRSYVDGIQAGLPMAELQANVRQVMAEKVIPKYTRIGPDRELVAYWQTTLSEVRELRTEDPRYCAAFILGSTDGKSVDLTGKVSKKALESDLESLAALVNAGASASASVPSESSVQGPLRRAASRAEQTMPGALTLVATPAKASPAKLCSAELAFFDAIVSLPPSEAGPVLRYLAAAGG